MDYHVKKIWINKNKTRFVNVYLFKNLKIMNKAHKDLSGKNISIYGCHFAFYAKNTETKKTLKHSGDVFLSLGRLGSSVVAHEFLHAVLWAKGHRWGKKQYPIVINSMCQEENICYNLSHCLYQFYTWYYNKIHNKWK